MDQTGIAVIDIGSNSIRYLGRAPEKHLMTTRLAEGLVSTGVLSEAAMARSIAAITAFVQDARAEGLTPCAYATSAYGMPATAKNFLPGWRQPAAFASTCSPASVKRNTRISARPQKAGS